MDPSLFLKRGHRPTRNRVYGSSTKDTPIDISTKYFIRGARKKSRRLSNMPFPLDKHISARSGGHLSPCQHLQNDEILIDMKAVNSCFEYDIQTELINFRPGLTFRDAQEFLTPRNLFFPFGHSLTGGLAGFMLAGGQGYFMQRWGIAADRWAVKLEIVSVDGEIRICNRDKNDDCWLELGRSRIPKDELEVLEKRNK